MSQHMERMALGETIDVKGPPGALHLRWLRRLPQQRQEGLCQEDEHDCWGHRHHAHVPNHQGGPCP